MKTPQISVSFAGCLVLAALIQPSGAAFQGPPPNGPGMQGPGMQGGRGGPGAQPERKLVAQFDKDGDKRLNAVERKTAREFMAGQGQQGPGGGRMGGGRGGAAVTVEPGPRLTPADVKSYRGVPLYDAATLRTLFLQFENDDWEKEMMAFNNTDVEVPATLVVDGKTYKDVGLHFRGASSFFGVPAGQKHSINLSVDFAHADQDLEGYHTLNLLNSHEDPSHLRTVLYLEAARSYLPAPRANYVRLVINGESWGVYPSAEQFGKDFLREWFKTTGGARWKVPGSPGGRGGLEYLGDDVSQYKRLYEIKSKDDAKSWADLVRLCKVLNETPGDQLEAALAPILDVDGALKFLALETALVNNDGYWIRASDYSIYQDEKGRFHVFPHDANETFGPGGGRGMGGPGGGGPGGRRAGGPPPDGRGFGGMPPPPGGRGGPGGPGGPGGGGATLDPLNGLSDPTKPLRSKLLAVPALQKRYLDYVRDIATKWLDWKTLGPLAQKYQALIAADVKTDTHKLDGFEAFEAGLTALKNFADQRRAFLLSYQAK